MKRIYFESDLVFAETSNRDKIRGILDHLLEQGPVECWFYKCCRDFTEQAVDVIMEMNHPDLYVVDVVDPLLVDVDSVDIKDQEEEDFFPPGSVDRFVMANIKSGKAEKINKSGYSRWGKVKRWAWEQCDIIVAYYYDDLLDMKTERLKSFTKKKGIELIHIYDTKTEEMIRKKTSSLTGEDAILYKRRLAGDTYKEMVENLHTPYATVTSRTRSALNKIERIVAYDLKHQNKLDHANA